MTWPDGEEGPKAFDILIEARPGKSDEVLRTLNDILDKVQQEPATGPWYAVRHSETSFAIFETSPDAAGRQDGGGGDISNDISRMNAILPAPPTSRKSTSP